jgi:hypothetical protein
MNHEALVSKKHGLYRSFWFSHFYPQTNNSRWFGAGFMIKLTDLGFSKGVIVETVVSTYNLDGQPNAAPMGAIMENLQRIILRIYTSSLTYKNLQSKRCAVVNVTSNPELFYRTTFKEANPKGRMPQEWVEKAETIDAPRLRTADALIEVTVADTRPFDAERAEVSCDVKLVKASSVLPKVYCRALFATIEAIIHATRVKTFMTHGDRQKQEQASKLLERIRECNDVVNRVAPNSRYSEIMADLNQRVDSWRIKGESPR